MTGDEPVAVDQPDLVDRRHDRDRPMGMLDGDAVAVRIELHQRQRVSQGLGDAAGVKWLPRQIQHRLAVLGEQLALRSRLAAQRPVEVSIASLNQFGIELLQRLDSRYGDEEVAAGKPDQAFDLPLLIGPADQAEVGLEQIMALQPEELARQLPATAAGDLGDRHAAVVVADADRHGAKELKRSSVTFLKGLRAFSGERLDEDGVRVRQRHHEQRHLGPLARQIDVGEAEVDLRFARWMRQR